MRYFSDLDYISPSTKKSKTSTIQEERKDSDFARVSATLRRLEIHKQRLESDFRDPVSSQYKYVQERLDELQSFADRLLSENVRKQAQPDIVERNVRRFNTNLLKATGLRSPRLRPAQPGINKPLDTAWVGSRRVDEFPRTVFGTDAHITEGKPVSWIGRRVRKWTQPLRFYPMYFVTRSIALPCVERVVRKEVLFARKKAGRGYRVPHRRKQFTDIWC